MYTELSDKRNTSRVILDGVESMQVGVISDVTQGTVLGSRLFLFFQITSTPASDYSVFADDCIVDREVRSAKHCRGDRG